MSTLPLFDPPAVDLDAGPTLVCSECRTEPPAHVPGCSYLGASPPADLRTLPEKLRDAAKDWEFVGSLLREAAGRIEQLERAEWREEWTQFDRAAAEGKARSRQEAPTP